MKNQLTRAILLSTALLLSACAAPRALQPSNWHLPWRAAPAPPPQAVSELTVTGVDGVAVPVVPQYWDRNTLRLDLSALAGSGELRLAAKPPNGWPVRLAFTVRPGNLRHLEVRGDQRVLYTIAASGEPQTLLLAPGAYTAQTPGIALRWD